MNSEPEQDTADSAYKDLLHATSRRSQYRVFRKTVERVYRRLAETLAHSGPKSLPRVWQIHYLMDGIARTVLQSEVSKGTAPLFHFRRFQRPLKNVDWAREPLFDEGDPSSSSDMPADLALRSGQNQLDPLQTLAFRNGLLAVRRYVPEAVLKPILERLPQSVTEQRLIKLLSSAYAVHLQHVDTEVDSSHICIGTKAGTGSIVSSLIEQIEIPVCFLC